MTPPSHQLAKNQLGVAGIVFLVLAAVAPLTGIVVIAVLGIALGNGGGMVGSFLLVTGILLLFATGYAQMTRELVSAGGFYAVAVRGLGRPAGLAAGFIALIGYNFFVAGAVGTSGFFMQTIISELTGFDLHWFWWGLISVIAAFFLTRQGIDFSAKILGVCLVLEVSILLVFDVSVLVQTGYSFDAFRPQIVMSGAAGLGFLYAANAFVGFEATGLFSEEAKNPLRTIPRATFIAVAFIGLFAAVTTWAIVSATGVEQAQQAALDHVDAGDLVFVLAEQYLGQPLMVTMMVLLLISLFAALMALHNSATRYLYSLGRAGVLPRILSHTRKGGFPQNASLTQFVFAVLVAGIFALIGEHPLLSIVPVMTGFGTLGILSLQLIAAVSVVVYFRRKRDARLYSTFIAPGLGMIGLAVVVALAIANFPTLAGSNALFVTLLPWLLLVAAVAGAVAAHYLKSNRPEVYAALSNDLEQVTLQHLDSATSTVPVIDTEHP